MIIRNATREDLMNYYSGRELPGCSIRAYVAVVGGDVVAVAGIHHQKNGLSVAFSDISPSMRKKDIVKFGRAVVAAIKKRGKPVLAWCCNESSKKLLTHIGFVQVDCIGEKFVMRWGV